jgi:hypothetical protein
MAGPIRGGAADATGPARGGATIQTGRGLPSSGDSASGASRSSGSASGACGADGLCHEGETSVRNVAMARLIPEPA